MKRIIFLSLISILYIQDFSNVYAGVYANASVDIFYDSNAYKDFTKLQDFGSQSNLSLRYLSKISPSALGSFRYGFKSTYYSTENLYNKNFHYLKGYLRQKANTNMDYGMEAGWLVYDYPNLNSLSTHAPYANPFIRFYPVANVKSEIGYKYKAYNYPNYNLDSNNNEVYVSISAPLIKSMYIGIDADQEIFDYTERHLYALSSELTRVNTLTFRKDNIKTYSLSLTKLFNSDAESKISYTVINFDSNANEFYAALLLSGNLDVRLLSDFRSYVLNRVSAEFKSGSKGSLVFRFSGSYYLQKFSGWPARSTGGVILTPEQTRTDNYYDLTARLEREVLKNFSLSIFAGYEVNDTNDLIYNYIALVSGLGASYKF